VIADGRKVPNGSQLDADLCIIGAGAAGITLARQFVGRSTQVIVLESGGTEFDARTQALAQGECVGLPYFPLEASRLRRLGGTTNHWGGVCRPMEPQDFEPKAWVPHSGWPIGLAQIRPYYERARIICGVASPDWELGSWLGKDRLRPLPLAGKRITTRIAQVVPRKARSFAIVYRPDLEAARNVTVHCESNVTEIRTNDAGSLATRVEVATLAGTRFSVAARRFVLAAGGMENPRLLLLSNRQWPAGLGNGHDLVGRFFMEHPRFVGGLLVPTDPNLSVGLYDHHRVAGATLLGYLSIARETQQSERLLEVQMHLRPTMVDSFEHALASGDLDEVRELVTIVRRRRGLDDFGRHLANVVADLTTWQSFAVPGAPLPVPFPEVVGELMRSTPLEAQALIPDLLGDIVAGGYAKIHGAPIGSVRLRTRIEPVPNPDSRVTLGTERDELGQPRVSLDWRLTTSEHHSVRRSLEILGAELGRVGLGRIRIILDDDDRVWPDDLAGGWHHMGTTRMSDDPARGVVDRDGRVHGIHNLFVAGSSVFPTAGSATPTMTIVALALRLADHLKGLPA
jgi:choline dehydrogenase-like flavoprotein